MKAEKTRHLIFEALNQILCVGNHLKTKDIIWNHEWASERELREMEVLTEFAEAIQLADKNDVPYSYNANGHDGYLVHFNGEYIDLIEWYRMIKVKGD